jgi:tRNA pseudouridine55 synthase
LAQDKKPIHGIFLLDKPSGITSNRALQQVKKYFSAQKAGHTGSLDPLACGMLPICLGEATKLARFSLEAKKAYWVKVKLGETTTTGDSDGTLLVQRPVPPLTLAQLEQVAQNFSGAGQQIPPMFSALKYQGQRLYALARQGIEVERAARSIYIEQLQVQNLSLVAGQAEFQLQVQCSKGTYIRSLVMDIGEQLGCGAHVTELRRLWVDQFADFPMYGLEQMAHIATTQGEMGLNQLLLPLTSILQGIPKVVLPNNLALLWQQGQRLSMAAPTAIGWVQIHSEQGELLGMGEILANGQLAPKRVLQTKPRSSKIIADIVNG